MYDLTTEQLFPLLRTMTQPAFCIDRAGRVLSNEAASVLAPGSGAQLSTWLGDSWPMLEDWERASDLVCAVTCYGKNYSVTIQPLRNGTLFRMQSTEQDMSLTVVMSTISRLIRHSLTNMAMQLGFLSKHEEFRKLQGILTKEKTVLQRMAANLGDYPLFCRGNIKPRLEVVNMKVNLEQLMDHIQDTVSSMSRDIQFQPCKQDLIFHADKKMLERAQMNLISNALQFSPADTPVTVWYDSSADFVYFRVQNQCLDNGESLLRSSFHRLEIEISDPTKLQKEGLGIGLPLTYAIVKAHGGTLAVEVSNTGLATVTISFNRHRRPDQYFLRMPPLYDYAGGLPSEILELAHLLPASVFEQK